MTSQVQTVRGLTGFLVKLFVKKPEDTKNVKVREQYGKLSSITGIVVNLLLFAAKFIIGTLSGSVSIVGDSVNNLSDAGSSIISLVSFKLSNKPADTGHPFGHARVEYVSSSIIAVIILFIGVELMKTSVNKIIRPEAVDFSFLIILILVFSIGSKTWLFFFNRKLGRRIDSTILQATAADSLSDVLATSAVLLSGIISRVTGLMLDGWMGAVVAVLILLSGIRILRKTINSILGEGPSGETIQQIEEFIRKYEGVRGIHDLVVHDYGPGHCFASVHVEVDSNVDILISHDLIDNIERDIAFDMGIHLVIHLDPIVTDNPYVNELLHLTENVVKEVDATLSIHDFRVVIGSSHNNLIFDVLVPGECKLRECEIEDKINQGIKNLDSKLNVVLTLDRSYVSSPNQKIIK
ncbi:MAG: cation transporter [Thermoclostridium sp.]|nr:cation transporter [Thermoclostridium sp.]